MGTAFIASCLRTAHTRCKAKTAQTWQSSEKNVIFLGEKRKKIKNTHTKPNNNDDKNNSLVQISKSHWLYLEWTHAHQS